MNKKQTYVAPSADVLGIFGDFVLGSNDLPGDKFYDVNPAGDIING